MRRKLDVAIIVLRCAIIGLYVGEQQAALGAEMVIPSKPGTGVINKKIVDSNVMPQSLDAQLPESGHAQIFPLILPQPDLVASALQAVSGYILVAQETESADAPDEPQAAAQETKNADAPAKPQAIMQEIKSASPLPSGKQRRRKPKMAGVPDEAQAVAQKTTESGPQAAAQEAGKTGTPDKPLAEAQETRNADAPARPQTEVKGLKVADAGKKRYGMAPIRWAARLSETIGLERRSQTYSGAAGYDTRQSQLVNTQEVGVRADTYIVQPYIAKLGGDIGVVSSRNASSGSIGSSGRSNALSGNGDLSLFSQSRFPFTMALGVNNNRNKMELQSQDSVGRHMELSQSYRALGSPSSYRIGYTSSTRDTSNYLGLNALGGLSPGSTENHSGWNGNYSTATSEHHINATAMYNDKYSNSLDNTNRRENNFIMTDAYLPHDSMWSFNSYANINSFAYNGGNRSRYLLGNIGYAWQPGDESIPLYVNGSVHLFDQMATTQGAAARSQSLGGDVGANYIFSRNLTGMAGGSVARTNSSGQYDLATKQYGNVFYRSDAIRLWKDSSYSWNANGGATNQTGSASNRIISGGIGHGLTVPYPVNMLGKKWQSLSTVSQSLGANVDQLGGNNITLSNTGNVALNGILAAPVPRKELLGGYSEASGWNTSAVLAGTDTHTMGKNPSHGQIVSLMLSEANRSADAQSSLKVEATLGAVYRNYTQGPAGGNGFVGTGTATYDRQRVFNVRGLNYSGILGIGLAQPNSGISSVAAQNQRFSWSLDQRLSYRIGQNEALLRGNITDQYGVKNASLWMLLRAWRTVGN